VCSSGGSLHVRERDGLLPPPARADVLLPSVKDTPSDITVEDYSEHGHSAEPKSPQATREVKRARDSERGSTIGRPDALSCHLRLTGDRLQMLPVEGNSGPERGDERARDSPARLDPFHENGDEDSFGQVARLPHRVVRSIIAMLTKTETCCETTAGTHSSPPPRAKASGTRRRMTPNMSGFSH
jgi:hypothetical protein